MGQVKNGSALLSVLLFFYYMRPCVAMSLDVVHSDTESVNASIAKIHLHRKRDWRHENLNTNENLDCYRSETCRVPEQPDNQRLEGAGHCRPGYTQVGYDLQGCGSENYHVKTIKPICCADRTIRQFPKHQYCAWRGEPKKCREVGRMGDVVLFKSKLGGYPHNDTWLENAAACMKGDKWFTCPQPNWDGAHSMCKWKPCGEKCDKSNEVITAHVVGLNPGMLKRCPRPNAPPTAVRDHHEGSWLCCKKPQGPTTPQPIQNCHWVGTGQCFESTCSPHEVTIAYDRYGDKGDWKYKYATEPHCIYGTKKSLCCTVNWEALDYQNCHFGRACDPESEDEQVCPKRPNLWGEYMLEDDQGKKIRHDAPGETYEVLDKETGTKVVGIPRPYPMEEELFRLVKTEGQNRLITAFSMNDMVCGSTALKTITAATGSEEQLARQYVVDRLVDPRILQALVHSAITGKLPSGKPLRAQRIHASVFNEYFIKTSLPTATALHPTSGFNFTTQIPMELMAEALGSVTNLEGLALLQPSLAGRKKRLMDEDMTPMGMDRFRRLLKESVAKAKDEHKFLTPLREAIAVFHYIHHPVNKPLIEKVLASLHTAARIISNQIPSLANLEPILTEVASDWIDARAAETVEWTAARLAEVRAAFQHENWEMQFWDKYKEYNRSSLVIENWGAVQRAATRLDVELERDVVRGWGGEEKTVFALPFEEPGEAVKKGT